MKLSVEEAKRLNILDVARSLDMAMLKSSRNEYYWQEHDSLKINTEKNMFKWYSRDIGGDVIQLVRTVKGVTFKEAMSFLETGEFKTAQVEEKPKEPFKYLLEKYETSFDNARKYLKELRGLSDDTIDFFLKEKIISAVNRKTKDGYVEQVIVFKYFDENRNMIGGSLQGIQPNKERYLGKGYLKQIIYNSDGTAGVNVTVGEKADRLIFFEAPIDMMSYYELHKEKLNNVRLIAMEGLKETTLARYVTEHIITNSESRKTLDYSKSLTYLDYILKNTTYFEEEQNIGVINIAVDNDNAGINFINKLQERGLKFQTDLPPKLENKEKTDWNEVLVVQKKLEKSKGEINVEQNIGNKTIEELNAPFFNAEILDAYVEEVMQYYTKDITKADYLFPDGRMVSSWEYGLRGSDHRVIRNYFDAMKQPQLDILDNHPRDFWNLVHNGLGAVRLTPETQVALILEGQKLTPIQQEILKNSTFTVEVYQESKEITPEYFEKLGVDYKFEKEKVSNSYSKQEQSVNLQKLVDSKKLTQWTKNQQYYFVKGLNRVALKLDNGVLRISNKYSPKTDREKQYINNLLEGKDTELKNEINSKDIEKNKEKIIISNLIKNKDIKGLKEHMIGGLQEYVNSDQYKSYLEAINKFYSYSRRNIDLIYKQNPKATYVAGLKDWNNKFERRVNKGEKGLTIFRPILIDKVDENGKKIIDKNGKTEKKISGYRPVKVFDVSQTSGKDLPELIYNIEKNVENYEDIFGAIKIIADEDNIKIEFLDENLMKGSKGIYAPLRNTIFIQKGMSEGHTMKTLIHELTHAKFQKRTEGTKEEYNLNELHAESVAYITSNHLGLDTSEYSFGYLNVYMKDRKDFTDLDKILDNVHRDSKKLIEKIDERLEKIKENKLKKNTFENRIEQMKERQKEKIQQNKEEVQVEKKYPTHPTMK